jgi:hypothetical protein
MNGFIILESVFPKIPSILTSDLGFRESGEYRDLRAYELDIAGVVCGAFSRYLYRIHSDLLAAPESTAIGNAVASAHVVLETLASCRETAVRDLVDTEILEDFDYEPNVLESIKMHLKPNASALYRHWIEEQQHGGRS